MIGYILTVWCVVVFTTEEKVIFHHVSWENPLFHSDGKSPSDGHYMH